MKKWFIYYWNGNTKKGPVEKCNFTAAGNKKSQKNDIRIARERLLTCNEVYL